MLRTPILRSAAMFARELTSCGANSWLRPCRLRNATLRGLLLPGRVWDRIVMGLDGAPHGVWSDGCVNGSSAIGTNDGRLSRPVPPMMAMLTGPGTDQLDIQKLCEPCTLKSVLS